MSKEKNVIKAKGADKVKDLKKGVSDFKSFISRGNVVDMFIVGFIVGAMLGATITLGVHCCFIVGKGSDK